MTARLQRQIFGVRLSFSMAGLTAPQVRARVAVLDKLEADDQVDVVRSLAERHVTLAELVDLDRQGRLRGSEIRQAVIQRRPLWDTIDETLPRMGPTTATRLRYQVSLNALRERCQDLTPNATVSDLKRIDWAALQTAWLAVASPSDWNHLRRAVSRFLSVFLGDKWHPLRREVVNQIAAVKERERVPDLTLALFRDALAAVQEPLRPAYIVIAAHGLRVGEYLNLAEADLRPATLKMIVRGKTGERVVPVHPDMWAYVAAAVPSPLRYKALYGHWKAAVRAIGYGHATVHDLRHLAAQTASDQGASVVSIMELLGHSNTVMAGRYARQTEATRGSNAVAGALLKIVKEA